MGVAARYLNRELVGVFVVTLALLLLVAVGGRFMGYLQEAALGKFSGTTVLTIMALRLPEFVQLVAPFALYVATLLTLGRLYADSEAVILHSAGASTLRILGWISVTVVAVTAAIGWLSLYATPASQYTLNEYMIEQRSQSEFETVNPGAFHIYSGGTRVTYSEAISDDRTVLFDVFLAEKLESGREITLWAEEGRQQVDERTGSQFLLLSNGRRYEGLPGDADFRVMEFSELRQRLSVAPGSAKLDTEGTPTLALDETPEHRAEWHWRIALPLFCVIGACLAMGMSRVKPRQGRFARVVPGMTMLLLYYLQEAALGKFSGTTVLTIMALRLPEFVQLVAPFALYVATLLTLGRLYADSEAVILHSAGASTLRILGWISVTVVAVTAAIGWLSLYATPASQYTLNEYMIEQRSQSEFETVNPGAFHIYSGGTRVTYSEAISDDRTVLFDVFLAEKLESGREITLWAEEGRQQVDERTGSQFLLLSNGRRYEGLPGDADFRVMEFSELRQRLSVAPGSAKLDTEGTPTLALDETPEHRAEWHWRIALPLFCVIGACLAMGMSRVKPRQGRFARVVPGMTMLLLYYLALLLNRNGLAEAVVPLWMGMWVVHAVFAVCALVMLQRLGRPITA